MKTALIFGSSGLIGSQLANLIVNSEHYNKVQDVFNNVPTWLGFNSTSQSITGDGSTSSAINLTTAITEVDATSAAAPCTLAASSTDGQIKTVLNVSTSGTNNVTITPANFAQGTTVTLNAPGESVTFIYKSSKYYVLANNGGAIA